MRNEKHGVSMASACILEVSTTIMDTFAMLWLQVRRSIQLTQQNHGESAMGVL